MNNILKTQRSFARKAQASPTHQFQDLYHFLYRRDWLEAALQSVLSNRGARTPGVDGISKDDLKTPEDQAAFLDDLQEALKTKTYQPNPVDRAWVPKPGKKEKRGLGIPTMRDRVVQEVLRMLFEPIWESDFHDHSCGFRPGKRTMDAIHICRMRIHTQNRYYWVIEGDIRKCFDRINHKVLLRLIRKRIADHRIVKLVEAFLKAGVMDGGLFAETREGTPQGGIVSPLLANIYLHELDMWWWNKYGGLHRNEKKKRRDHKQGNAILVRYADDFIMLWNGTHEGALQLRDEIKTFLWEELHLELSEEKTHVTHVMDGFDFLGFHLQYQTRKGHRPMLIVTPKRDNIERFKAKVKRLTRRSSVLVPVDLRFQQLNSLIRGWGNYYRYANFTHDAKKLDWWISNRVLIWLQAKHKGQGTRAILEQYLVRETRKQYDRKNFAAKDGKGKLRFIARLQDIPILKYRFRKRPNPYLNAAGFVPPAEAETPFGDAVPANIGEQRTQWLETRQQAVERDEYRCSICGKDIDTTQLHGHHIEARRDGGKDELANISTLCEDCHKKTTTYGQKRKRQSG